jgi:hypothetical protein
VEFTGTARCMSGIMKAQIDWIPLSIGSVRPTQGKTLAVMQVCSGSVVDRRRIANRRRKRRLKQIETQRLLALSTAAASLMLVSYMNEGLHRKCSMNSTFFGLLAEFGEANIPLDKVAPKYFGLSRDEARRRALSKMLPCKAYRLGGQKAPWLISATDLAELIDRQRTKEA